MPRPSPNASDLSFSRHHQNLSEKPDYELPIINQQHPVVPSGTTFSRLRSTTPNPKLGGVSNNTLVRLSCLLIVLIAVIFAWIFASIAVQPASSNVGAPKGSTGGNTTAQDGSPSIAVTIVQLAFACCTLTLIICFYRTMLRAFVERRKYEAALQQESLPCYDSFLPDLQPTGMRQPTPARTRSLWNWRSDGTGCFGFGGRGRDGHLTGRRLSVWVETDTEEVIAGPPPAYGQNRGSRLLLRGLRPGTGDSSRTTSRRSFLESIRRPNTGDSSHRPATGESHRPGTTASHRTGRTIRIQEPPQRPPTNGSGSASAGGSSLAGSDQQHPWLDRRIRRHLTTADSQHTTKTTSTMPTVMEGRPITGDSVQSTRTFGPGQASSPLSARPETGASARSHWSAVTRSYRPDTGNSQATTESNWDEVDEATQ